MARNNATIGRQEKMYSFLVAERKRIDGLLAKIKPSGKNADEGKRGYVPRLENKFTLDEAISKVLSKKAKTTPDIIQAIRDRKLYNSNSDTFEMRVNVRLNELAKNGTINKEGRGLFSKASEAPKRKKRTKKAEESQQETTV